MNLKIQPSAGITWDKKTFFYEDLGLKINLTMTRSNVHSWPTGAERAIRWNFCELCVFKETLLICHCADVDLLWNAFMRLAYSRGLRFSPADNCSHRMNENRIEGWEANRLHWTSQWNWVFHSCQSDVCIKVFRIEFPILMHLYFNKFSPLRMFFKISQVIFAGKHISVLNRMKLLRLALALW